jgi:hypothetical protein
VVEAVRALATASVARLDLGTHQGPIRAWACSMWCRSSPTNPASPRCTTSAPSCPLRDEFARWLGATWACRASSTDPFPAAGPYITPGQAPCLRELAPDFGPGHPIPTAGATAVGARSVLVAYNVWVSSVEVARRWRPWSAARGARARLAVGDRAQVSCNLVDPATVRAGPALRRVADLVEEAGGTVEGAELVGLIPSRSSTAIAPGRWAELGLSAEATVEAACRTPDRPARRGSAARP